MAWPNEKNIIVSVRGVNANLRDAGPSLRDGILVDYDEGTFSQVLSNVVENAVKYSDDYSDIMIDVSDRLGFGTHRSDDQRHWITEGGSREDL